MSALTVIRYCKALNDEGLNPHGINHSDSRHHAVSNMETHLLPNSAQIWLAHNPGIQLAPIPHTVQ